MENTEEIMQILERFTRLKQKEIPKELDEYLQYVAKTGDTIFKWPTLKYLFREKFLSVIKHFHDTSPRVDDLPQYPNVDPFNYETLKSALLERLELFNAAPFTIQRLCELLIDPRKQYSRIDKFMRALEKNILVVSTVEPGRKRDESENGDSLDSVVNGDLSLDVNVDIDMENESIFNIDIKNKLPHTSMHQSQKTLQSPSHQPSSNPVHRSDDEVLPNPKKQKLETEKASTIESSEKNNPITPEGSSLTEASSETEVVKGDASQEATSENDTNSTPVVTNKDHPVKEEVKTEPNPVIAENKTELVIVTKTIEEPNEIDTKSSERIDCSTTEVKNEKTAKDNLEDKKLNSEKKESAEDCSIRASALSQEDTKTTNIQKENENTAEENEVSAEDEKKVEVSEKETILKSEEITHKESNASTIDSNKEAAENPIMKTNLQSQDDDNNHENKDKKAEPFEVEESKEKLVENTELPTASAVVLSGQPDQPMDENAESTTVTVNNISLTIPDNVAPANEVIMGDGAEMATDSVEPIKDDSITLPTSTDTTNLIDDKKMSGEEMEMEIDDTSQEAMDQ